MQLLRYFCYGLITAIYATQYKVVGTICHDNVTEVRHLIPLNDEEVYDDYDRTDMFQEKMVIEGITTICRNAILPLTKINTTNCNQCQRILKLEKSSISVIPPSAFLHQPEFTILFLCGLNISQILPGAFGQPTLTEIHLSGNNLSEITLGVFNSLHRLEVLNLSKNKLQVLPKHCLSGMVNLKTLDLSNNRLISFYFSTFDPNLNKMKRLDLSYNKISKFEVDININISDVILNNNSLTSIDFCAQMFRVLTMSMNQLQHLMTTRCTTNEAYLIDLDLSYNDIKSIDPQYFKTASYLLRLNLSNNNISNLPNEIFNDVQMLQYLNISSNALNNLQFGIFDNLENLQILDISNNQLRGYPKSLHALSKLQQLYLDNNDISAIDTKRFFTDFPALNRISLNNIGLPCDNLIDFFHIFKTKGIIVQRQTLKNTSNVHGISCENAEENLLPKTIPNKNSSPEFFDKVLQNYFNKDFKNSNFFRFLNENPSQNMQAMQKNGRATEISLLEENLEENSKHLKNLTYLLKEYLAKESITNSYKELKNNVTRVGHLHQTTASKFTDVKSEKNVNSETNDYDKVVVLLSINTSLFIFICVCFLLAVLFYCFKSSSQILKLNHEEVELVDHC